MSHLPTIVHVLQCIPFACRSEPREVILGVDKTTFKTAQTLNYAPCRDAVAWKGSLVDAVKQLQPLDVIRPLLDQQSRASIEDVRDEHDLNILHYSILWQHTEVVRLLLMKGYFQETHRPPSVPYLHLACHIGHSLIASILLQERPSDYDVTISPVTWLYMAQLVPSTEVTSPPVDIIKDHHELTPVDVASWSGNIKCVYVMLNYLPPKPKSMFSNGRFSALERAVQVNSTRSLQLILSDNPDEGDTRRAAKEALRHKMDECLDVLLKHGVSMTTVLNGMNPYHFMYMYASAFQTGKGQGKRHKGLPQSTAVLIRHNFDVNNSDLIGSYPLYSLLYSLIQEKDYNPSSVPEYHIETLQTLLAAGARTDFDEVQHITSRSSDADVSELPMIGRELYTSALNAFLMPLQSSDAWRPHMKQYLDQCVLSLLEHGADPAHVNSFGETPLHDLMKALAMQHAMGHMFIDLSNVCRMLLLHGASPNVAAPSGFYPISHYFSTLCKMMGGLYAFERWRQTDCVPQILNLLFYMDQDKVVQAYHQVTQVLVEAKSDGMSDSIISYVQELFRRFMTKTRTLCDLSRLGVWKAAGRKKENLSAWHMPVLLRRHVIEMFDE